MKQVITAAEVEAAAANGNQQLVPENGALLTPLARDRAAALGLVILDGQPPDRPETFWSRAVPAVRITARPELDVKRLVVESKVRVVARRVLLRTGRGPGELESLVGAVMRRLDAETGEARECGCESRGCGSKP